MGKVAFFAPDDADLALERNSAVNLQLIHELGSPGSHIPRAYKTLQRERVDLVAHRWAPASAYTSLCRCTARLPEKARGDHHRLEMHVVLARDRRPAAGQALAESARLLVVGSCPLLKLYHSTDGP